VAESRLKVYELDICSEDAHEVVQEAKPQRLFQTAGQINVRRSVSEPAFDAQLNVVGTVKMLEAARQAGVSTFVFSSTGGAIYGEQEQFPAAEDHPCHPECQYGVGKRSAELYLEYYARAYGLTTVALRYANVFGPRQNPKGEAGVVAIFTDRLVAGEELVVNGDGKQTRDFVYVSDVANANIRASTITDSGKHLIYNVGRGVETSVLDIVAALRSAWTETTLAGEETAPFVDVRHGPALEGEQQRSVVDTTRLQSDLEWRAEVNLKQGLRTTVESFRRP